LIGDSKYSVKLSELIEADSPILFEWINNRELVEFNSNFKPVAWDDHCKWFDNVRKKPDLKIFGIRTAKDEKLIGSCQLMHINQASQSAELQIRLGSFSDMGKGFGSQAVALLLGYGFTVLKLQRIYLHVFSDNERAYKSYLKNGFKEEGHLRRAAFVNNRFVDIKIMGILKEEYHT
jgi:RimJ/RimL family protein N-acetyltransferase